MLGDLVAGYGSSESDGAEADAELSIRAPATQLPAQLKPAAASAPVLQPPLPGSLPVGK